MVLKFLNTSQTLNIHFKKYTLKQKGVEKDTNNCPTTKPPITATSMLMH